MIRVGFYKELKHGRPDGESLTAALSTSAGPDDTKLVQYLKAGTTMMVAPGPMRDVLAANVIIGTLEIRTDGTYAWPSDLPHYIERYHARVPAEFTQHVRANGFVVPASIDLSVVELG